MDGDLYGGDLLEGLSSIYHDVEIWNTFTRDVLESPYPMTAPSDSSMIHDFGTPLTGAAIETNGNIPSELLTVNEAPSLLTDLSSTPPDNQVLSSPPPKMLVLGVKIHRLTNRRTSSVVQVRFCTVLADPLTATTETDYSPVLCSEPSTDAR